MLWRGGIPAIKKSFGLKLRCFRSREKLGVRFALAHMRTGSGGVVFSIVDRLNRVGFPRVPLAPACGKNVRAHLGVEKDHLRIRTPWPAKPDILRASRSRQRAVVEDKAAVLRRIVLRLGCEKPFGVRSAVNLAVIKDSFAVAENEIDIALDIAVREVLASRCAGLAVGSAVATAGVERVLIPKEANIIEDGLVGGDQHGQRLRADRHLRMRGVPIVGEGEVLGAEVIAAYFGGSRVQRAA